MTAIRILSEADVRKLITPEDALWAVRDAFLALHRGKVALPEVIHLRIDEHAGETHAKGAYIHGSDFFTLKVASGFARNPERGLPVTSGLSLVFDATSGRPVVGIFDNGYLTELRTGAAGALAADLLARRDAKVAVVVGAGSQARFQIEALRLVRPIARCLVASRDPGRAQAYADEMRRLHGLDARVAASVEAGVREADVIITTTPARSPIIEADWVQPGTHITAVGSDFPDKQELDVELLARADALVVDVIEQAKTQGELHHALDAGVLDDAVVQTIGALVAGEDRGRRHDNDVTIADLTGVGVQDAAVAALVAQRAADASTGRLVDVNGTG